MNLAAFASDGASRTVASADCTACAELFYYVITDQSLTDFGGTSFFDNVSFIFIPKKVEGAYNGVGSAGAQPAQTGSTDLGRKHFQGVNVTGVAQAGAYFL